MREDEDDEALLRTRMMKHVGPDGTRPIPFGPPRPPQHAYQDVSVWGVRGIPNQETRATPNVQFNIRNYISYIQHSRHASLQGDNDHVDEAEDEEDADIDHDDDEVNYTMTPQR